MNLKTSTVFHGFLQLPNLEKLEVVNAINDYFDSTDRETIRAAADAEYARLTGEQQSGECPCCGK